MIKVKLLQVTKAVIRHLAFHDGKRVDGRALNELRPITCKVKCDNGKICFSYKEIPTQSRLDFTSLCTDQVFFRGVRPR